MTSKQQKKILVVDDNNANLTACRNILKPHYMVYPAQSAAKMFGLIENVIPDLILMDVDMPDMNGYEAAGRMKKTEAYKNIPIIFLSGRVDPASEIFGLNMGALDYIHKPFVSELLLRRIKTHLSLIDYQKILERGNESVDELYKRGSELNPPLNQILSLLDKTAAAEDLEKMRGGINEARAAISDLLNLAKDIFDHSKVESPQE